MTYYCFKRIEPIQIEISKLIFKKEKNGKLNENEKMRLDKGNKIGILYSTKKLLYEGNKKNKNNFPPKKQKKSVYEEYNSEKNKNTEHFDLIDCSPKEKNKQSLKSHFKKKNVKIINKKYGNSNSVILSENNFSPSKFKKGKSETTQKNKKLSKKKYENDSLSDNENMETLSIRFEDYDNFELNNLDYIPACEIDKRSFFVSY